MKLEKVSTSEYKKDVLIKIVNTRFKRKREFTNVKTRL